MQTNGINNVNFGNLHIKPTVTNRLTVERFLSKNAEATNEMFDNINRESGNEDVYFYSSNFDSGNIEIAITDREGNIYTAKRVGLGSPENFQRSVEKFTHNFIRTTMEPKPSRPAKNKEVSAILNRYA